MPGTTQVQLSLCKRCFTGVWKSSECTFYHHESINPCDKCKHTTGVNLYTVYYEEVINDAITVAQPRVTEPKPNLDTGGRRKRRGRDKA